MSTLAESHIDRKNVLNNNYALEEVQKAIGFKGVLFEGQYWYSRKQVMDFYGISEDTLDRYLEKFSSELKENGYELLTGKRLNEAIKVFATRINAGSKVRVLGLFNFRAFLNLGMLLIVSEKAKILRNIILDIVLDTINQKVSGNTKYINQRDENFVLTLMGGEDYRKEFTTALNKYVDMGLGKYGIYTNKIYVAIFKEKANEYRNILRLTKNENVRDTMYAEVLDLISSFETELAGRLTKQAAEKNRKLSSEEVDDLFDEVAKLRAFKPLISKARRIMASRDYGFRGALHEKLAEYLGSVPPEDYERFLGEKSRDLIIRLQEAKEVFERLKDR